MDFLKHVGKTNVGAIIGATGLYLRSTGKGDVADGMDAVAAMVPELMTAVGALLVSIGIGHKVDKLKTD